MLGGKRIIDISDWINHTVYRNGYDENSTIVVQFWEYMKTLDQKGLSKVLQFSTGASRLPAGGFDDLPDNGFCLYRVSGDETDGIKILPTARTCFYQLNLPDYSNDGILKDRFDLAIGSSEGFEEAREMMHGEVEFDSDTEDEEEEGEEWESWSDYINPVN